MGKLVQQYERIKTLGSGGQGEVFLVRAEDEKKYALKVYNQETTHAEIEREIKLLLTLDHPHIITIKDFGYLQDKQIYTVSQYFSQGSLVDVEKKRFISIKDKLAIYRDIANALHYLHDNEIVHRDIKPGNIFVKKIRNSYQGYLGDFGVAKQTEDSMLTRSLHGGLGTELYLPPEVLLNEEKASYSSDIYAYGVSMYYSLTGKLPHGDTAQELIDQLQAPKPAQKLSDFLYNSPEELEGLVQGMIHHDKKSRNIDLEGCIQLLEELIESSKIENVERIEDNHYHTSQDQKNKRKVFIPLVLAGSLLLTSYGVYKHNQDRKVDSKPKVQEKKITNFEQQEKSIEEAVIKISKKVIKKPELPQKKVWEGLTSFYDMEVNDLEPLVKDLIENKRKLPSGYIDDLYSTVRYISMQSKKKAKQEVYDKVMAGAILLKTEYSKFTKEELMHYWECQSEPVKHTDNIIHIPQYTFLKGISPFSKSSVELRNYGAYMYSFLSRKDMHIYVKETMRKLDRVSGELFEDIKKELQMDICLRAAQNLETHIKALIFALNSKYLKEMNIYNKYITPFKFAQSPQSYHKLHRIDVLYEFAGLVAKRLESETSNKNYIDYYNSLVDERREIIAKYNNDLDFAPIQAAVARYKEIIINKKQRSKEIKTFGWIHHLIAYKEITHVLYQRAYKFSQEIKGLKSERLEKKRSKILFEILKGAPLKDQERYGREFLDVQKNYFMNYTGIKEQYYILNEALLNDRISNVFTNKDSLFFANHMQSSLMDKKFAQNLLIPRQYLQVLSNYRKYDHVIQFFKGVKDLFLTDDFLQKKIALDSLIIVTNAYIQDNRYEEGKLFMNENGYKEKSMKALEKYIDNNGASSKVKIDRIVRLLGVISQLYKTYETPKEKTNILKIYQLTEKYFNDFYTYKKIERHESYNIFTARLDIKRAYINYIEQYGSEKQIEDFLKEEVSFKWYFEKNIKQKDKLYYRLLNCYSGHINLYNKHKNKVSSSLLKEIKLALDNKSLRKSIANSEKGKEEYQYLKQLYLNYMSTNK